MKEKVIYDIESLPNFFCVVFSMLDSDKIAKFEISARRNDRMKIIQMAKTYELIAHNGHRYDDTLLNYIGKNKNCTAKSINKISQSIIGGKFDHKKYENPSWITSIDTMTMLASSKLRVSLKHLQVMIKWHNVLEFDCDWNKDLPMCRWDECIDYCVNDVLSLKALCKTLGKDFQLREFVTKSTGLNVKSLDPVKIAELTMADAIAKGFHQPVNSFIDEVLSVNEPIQSINVNELILPFVKFESPKFNRILDIYRNFDLRPQVEASLPKNEKFKAPLILDGKYFNFGLGGLHHDYGRSKKFSGSDKVKLIQADVTSYYPSIRIEHLGHRFDPYFLKEYAKAYDEKAEGKATGNKMLEGYAKLKLNSTFGLYNSVYSPLFSPLTAYGTTINGQLMLGMLIEMLWMNGFDVIGANTDAVNVFVPVNRWDEYIAICNEWESITKMGLDHDEYSNIYEHSCNNYIAIAPNGYAKTKGFFVPDLNILKGYQYPIVKMALIDYFTKNIPIEKTICEHDDIYDFCMSTKMGKAKNGSMFEAVHEGVTLQRTNRYYASKNGGYLYKKAGTAKAQHVMKDSGVTIFNKFEEKAMPDYRVNYDFYLREARKIQRDIEPEQITLF